MKAPYLLLIITLLFSSKVLSQNVSDTTNREDDKIFTVIEESAEFPGGMTALYNFLVKELQFPEDARKNGITGKVFVQFVVTKDGSIDKESIMILKSLSSSCDQEAVRLIKIMPNWKPGRQHGKAVNTRFVLPLTFDSTKK